MFGLFDAYIYSIYETYISINIQLCKPFNVYYTILHVKLKLVSLFTKLIFKDTIKLVNTLNIDFINKLSYSVTGRLSVIRVKHDIKIV